MTNQHISPQKIKQLEHHMQSLGINESDIEETFIKGSGAGGQKVNKTNSCVYLKHIPTGIEIKCQKTRFRESNRFFAKRILCEKVEELTLGKKSKAQQKIDKLRKNKSKKKKRSKDKYQDKSPSGT